MAKYLSSLQALIIMIFSFSVSAARGKQNLSVSFSVSVNASKVKDWFEKNIGTAYTLKTMDNSTGFIWKTLRTYNTSVKKVGLFIEDMDVDVAAKTTGDRIHVNAGYIQGYKDNVSNEFTGILFSQMTRVWLWHGNCSRTTESVVGGVADYMRMTAGYEPTRGWVKRQGGERWNESSDVTARFFAFCEYVTSGFIQQLSQDMRSKTFDIEDCISNFFQQPLQTMWRYYKNGHVPH